MGIARIVRSRAGHDKGDLFCVIGTDGELLLLADGKRRTVTSPKRKKRRHVAEMGTYGHPAIRRLLCGEPVSNSELRRALAAFRDQGGNKAWQKAT